MNKRKRVAQQKHRLKAQRLKRKSKAQAGTAATARSAPAHR